MNDLPEYWENVLLDAIDGEIGWAGEEFSEKVYDVSVEIMKEVLWDAITEATLSGWYGGRVVRNMDTIRDETLKKYSCQKEKK